MSQPKSAVLVSSDPSWRDALRSSIADAVCNACGKPLGRITVLRIDADWDEWNVGDHASDLVVTQTADIGARTTLEPGFVNAKRRHPSGARRWLVRGPDPTRPSPEPRLPAVVTCSCGIENLLESRSQQWSSMTSEQVHEKARNDRAEDVAADQALSEWKDSGREHW